MGDVDAPETSPWRVGDTGTTIDGLKTGGEIKGAVLGFANLDAGCYEKFLVCCWGWDWWVECS